MDYPIRKNIRIPGYDYSQNGTYFVTICTYNRNNLFDICVGTTLCGRPPVPRNTNAVIEKWLGEIENRFLNAKIDKYVIMPNHVHAIILLAGDHAGSPLQAAGDHAGSPLPKIVNWFKTMTTNAYIKGVKDAIFPPFDKHIWQRGYFEHVIRNDEDYLRIWQYIEGNPAKWAEDEYYRK